MRRALPLLVALAVAGSAEAQYSLRIATPTAGASTSAGGPYTLRALVGEPASGGSSGGAAAGGFGLLAVSRGATGTDGGSVSGEHSPEDVPDAFAIGVPYPNPATHVATVRIRLPSAAEVEVAVYDLLGREVSRTRAAHGAGEHEARLEVGQLAAGVYVVQVGARLPQGPLAQTARLVVAR
ncbi:MAG: T9SS type A sorting domain-containing protein [Bacteroidota bacterium]